MQYQFVSGENRRCIFSNEKSHFFIKRVHMEDKYIGAYTITYGCNPWSQEHPPWIKRFYQERSLSTFVSDTCKCSASNCLYLARQVHYWQDPARSNPDPIQPSRPSHWLRPRPWPDQALWQRVFPLKWVIHHPLHHHPLHTKSGTLISRFG